MVKQTADQLKASDPLSSVWVGASAGTGKTFVLTNRVLRLMLSGTNPDKILCLTYTNAAAAEMAIRVNKRLAEWVTFDEKKFIDELSDLLGHTPDEKQKNLARKLFAKVLDVPGGLKIQTIHSFCQSLLGRFPIEANISPNFTLLDEITINEHLRLSQDEILQDIQHGQSKKLKTALDFLSAQLAEETFVKLMKNLANERGGLEYLNQINKSSFDEIILSLRKILGLSETDSIESILYVAGEDNNFDGDGLGRVANTLLQTTKRYIDNGDKIISWLNLDNSRSDGFEHYKSAFLKKDGDIKSDDFLMSIKVREKEPEMFEILQNEADRVLNIDEHIRKLHLLENCQAMLRLAYALINTYNKRKKNHNVVDFDDLILKVRGLFDRDNIASWILYKLDGGLDHILIDEAQDTNPEQWKIISKLVLEFFSGIGTRSEKSFKEKPRTIFAVGDVKQSIYSFQKAEPKLFNVTREYFEDQVQNAGLDFSTVPMNLSFRSTSGILEVVDEVFKSEVDRKAISFKIDEIKHKSHREGQAGLVEIWDSVKPEENENDESWSPPIIQKTEHDPKRIVAERIADQIECWIKSGEKLASKDRLITAGDIIILVQKRKDFVHHMIRSLKRRKISVAGLDRMALKEQLAVMDLMAVANFTLLPNDNLTLAVVLKSPLIGLCEDDLIDLAVTRLEGQSLWAALLKRRNDKQSFADAADYLTELTKQADFQPPFEFFSHLLGPMGGREKILARLKDQANDPIDEYLNQALKFEQNNISSMQGFLSWIERGDITIKRDMEQGGDMVRIMTVHGAKGLQAPIVFLPDTCQAVRMQDNLFWYEEKYNQNLLWVRDQDTRIGAGKTAYDDHKRAIEDENKRLLYVAMTRAEDRLYVTGFEDKNGRKEDCWYDMIKNAVSQMDGVDEIKMAEKTILRREQKQTSPVKITKEDEKVAYKVPELPDWTFSLPEPEPIPSRPLSPSRDDDEEEVSISPLKIAEHVTKDKQKYHRGRLIHKLLEILPDLSAVERREGTVRYLSQKALDLTSGDLEQISDEVMAIIENDDFSGLFGPGSRAEVPIVGQVGDYTLSGQVDRLAILDGEILIVDYKTNRPPPKSAAAIPKIYQRQMAAYKAILSEIYPNHKVRSFLLWTDIGSLMEIPDEILNKITF